MAKSNSVEIQQDGNKKAVFINGKEVPDCFVERLNPDRSISITLYGYFLEATDVPHEYEKVDVEAWKVVKMMSEGEKLYVKAIDSYVLITPNYSIALIHKDINNIYTRKETPWWEGCEGSVIMARDSESEEWKADIFSEKTDCWFECVGNTWNQARPLTTAERDAIKVQD